MLWKSSSGRSNGQPAMLDCSGKAGIVDGGDWEGRKFWLWVEYGSGWGNMGGAGDVGRWMRMRVEMKRRLKE